MGHAKRTFKQKQAAARAKVSKREVSRQSRGITTKRERTAGVSESLAQSRTELAEAQRVAAGPQEIKTAKVQAPAALAEPGKPITTFQTLDETQKVDEGILGTGITGGDILRAGTAVVASSPVGGAALALGGGAAKLGASLLASKLFQTGVEFTATASGRISQNIATAGFIQNILKTVTNPKTLLAAGGAAFALYSTKLMGLWGGAEAPEGISIPETRVIDQAKETGDWSTFDELMDARREIFSEEKEEQFIDGIPLIGDLKQWVENIKQKYEATRAGAKALDQYGENEKIRQQTGEDDRSYWERVRQQQAEQERLNVDYYNEQRRNMVEWEREAKVQARNEDAAFWRKEAEKTRKAEAKDREEIADFWLNYRKLVLEINDASRPSKLNFGLL